MGVVVVLLTIAQAELQQLIRVQCCLEHGSGLAGRLSCACYVLAQNMAPGLLAAHPAGLWIARREELGHPLGTITPSSLSSSSDDDSAAAAASTSGSPELFVLEVGSEELPPDDVLSGMEQLR